MTPPTRAPTAAELLTDVTVQAALDQAWVDSLPQDPSSRHEEGGWIYMDLLTGHLTIRRVSAGGTATINLDHPDLVPAATVVGCFHTHPHPAAEGWTTGPSGFDLFNDA